MVLPNFSVSFSAFYGRNFDAFQEHHQVWPDQFHRGIFTHFQAAKSTLFQFLVPDSKAITVPHKQLDLIPPFIDEDEILEETEIIEEENKINNVEDLIHKDNKDEYNINDDEELQSFNDLFLND